MKRSNQFLFGVWMLHFRIQKREHFSHSFWYPLQTPADDARSRGHQEVADMIDNFQVCFGSLNESGYTSFNQIRLLLINNFTGLSSKLFLLCFEKFLNSYFQGNQGARCCLNGLRIERQGSFNKEVGSKIFSMFLDYWYSFVLSLQMYLCWFIGNREQKWWPKVDERDSFSHIT